jgi:hypothetical protein
MFQTIETANALLQHDKVDSTLDLKMVNPLLFKRYPELRDVVHTACQIGEFGSIVELGESLLTCQKAFLLTVGGNADIFRKAEPGNS